MDCKASSVMQPRDLADLHEDEHAVVGAEQLRHEQLEEFLLHAARIYAVLPDKVHAKGLVQVSGPLPGYFVQSILPGMPPRSAEGKLSSEIALDST